MHQKPIVIIVGTRPEGIKMVPVYLDLKKRGFSVLLCATMQHDKLLADIFQLFQIIPDVTLDIMRMHQDLFYITQSVLQKTKELFSSVKPSLVLVQGDTTSSMAAALAAFYQEIPVGHIEAGLRTNDIYAPFPEEMNRRIISQIARYHFAPTDLAVMHLKKENHNSDSIFCTGNTVVDAMHLMRNKIDNNEISIRSDIKDFFEETKKNNKKIFVLTAHRRESFNGGLNTIFTVIKEFLYNNPDLHCFFPYHPNPHVITAIEKSRLSTLNNIFVTEPVAYKDMIYALDNCDWVVTDSGGIQEEAISLSKTVIVLRDKTERQEGINAGIAQLVGVDKDKIRTSLQELLEESTSITSNLEIYGNGTAAQKIGTIIQNTIQTEPKPSSYITKKEGMEIRPAKKDMKMKKVCVIGLGYIGLPTAIMIADAGVDVAGYDIDVDRVASINQGDPVIEEPEIFERLQLVLQSEKFWASTTITPAKFFMIAVPTPFTKEKTADLSYVFEAAKQISKVLKKGNVVILESTVPVGATKQLANILEKETGFKVGTDIFVAHCPERVLPGKIFKELVENDRIIGGIDKLSAQKAKDLYNYFVKGNIYLTKSDAAEMVKLVENSSRDCELAFAHQVASMAYCKGLNPYEIIELANKHPRVNILRPTCGVGGHCIAVDPWFLIESFPQNSQLLKSARLINDKKPKEVLDCIKKTVEKWQDKKKKECTVLVLGATYKADIDDVRESPALQIIKQLEQLQNIELLVCEPHIKEKVLKQHINSTLVVQTEGLLKADIVVFLVAHSRFYAIDQKTLADKTILDFCGVMYNSSKADNKDHLFWAASPSFDFFTINEKIEKEV